MQCSSPAQTLSHSTPRSSPASRVRRRGVILPTPPVPSMRLIPTHSTDSRKSTLLPYYHTTSPALKTPSIRSRAPPAAPLALSSELRLPPVDPRKARRYCTDFGFAHNRPTQPLPPPPPMYHHDNSSSAGSTPQATYAETDSDASSFYHHIDLEFPQPPASPALRRMQSSPLFTAEETDAVREFLRKRWGTHNVKALQPQLLPGQSPLSDYSWDALSPECGSDALELAGEQLMQAPPVEAHWLQTTPEPNVAPLSPRRSIGPPARVLRRAASMADPPTPLLLLETAPPPLPPRSLRFQDAPLPSLASVGRQKPRHHRANLSVPLMGLGIPDAARPALGSAFAAHPGGHRSARSQPADLAGAPRGGPDPRSFIDLTPEKIVQRGSTANVHRERVKRLLSRASSGFIGWGKALAGKKAHH